MSKKEKNSSSYLKDEQIEKLSLYVAIVTTGKGNAISKLFASFDSSFTWISDGKGTASKSVYEILGLTDNTKEIVFSVIKDEYVDEISRELDDFFHSHKSNNGIGFAIPFKALASRVAYNLLAGKI